MLLRQTIFYLPAQIIGPLAQVCAAIVWTHWLAPAPYGLLTFIIASQDLLFLICMSWWTHYTMRYLGALDGSARIDFLRSEPPIFLLTSILQMLGVVVVVMLVLHQPLAPLQIGAAAAYTGTRSLLNHLGERARAQSHIAGYTVGQFFGSVLGFAAAYAAVAIVSPTLESVLFGFAAAQGLGVLVLWRQLGVRGNLRPPISVLRAALDYGAPLLVAGGLAWLAQNGIRLIVEWSDGANALGLLAVGWGLGLRLSTTLAMLVITASFPLAVQSLKRGSRQEAFDHLARGGALLSGLIVPASIGICFLVGPFVTLFVAGPFRHATIMVLPFAAATGAIRNIRMHVADPVFLLIERPKVSTILNSIDALLVMAGCAFGAWAGGLIGAVVTCMIATTISAIVGFAMAATIAGFHFLYKDGVRILVASLIMSVTLALVPWSSLIQSDAARIVIEGGAGLIVYAGVIVPLYLAEARTLLSAVVARIQRQKIGLS